MLRFAATACLTTLLAATPLLAGDFAQTIETAHNGAAYDARSAVEAELVVEFGGQKILGGTMLFDAPVGKVRMELDQGSVLVFDGQDAWLTGPDVQRARFHALTWPYFLAAPFKLDDPGANLRGLEPMPWREGAMLPASELTFGDGVGDSPDDWYVVYRDPATNRLAGLGYIVTYGTTVEQAEAEPHAVSYDRYVEVDGVWLATEWTFWMWSREVGVSGDPIGRVSIDNPRFVTPPAEAFDKPEGARKAPKP